MLTLFCLKRSLFEDTTRLSFGFKSTILSPLKTSSKLTDTTSFVTPLDILKIYALDLYADSVSPPESSIKLRTFEAFSIEYSPGIFTPP